MLRKVNLTVALSEAVPHPLGDPHPPAAAEAVLVIEHQAGPRSTGRMSVRRQTWAATPPPRGRPYGDLRAGADLPPRRRETAGGRSAATNASQRERRTSGRYASRPPCRGRSAARRARQALRVHRRELNPRRRAGCRQERLGRNENKGIIRKKIDDIINNFFYIITPILSRYTTLYY